MDSVFKANRKQFLAAVKLAAKFTEKSFDKLNGMLLIEGGDHGVTVSGINSGQRRIDATIGCQPLGDGWPAGVFVSGKLLVEVLALMPSQMVRIGWDAKEMVVEGDEGRSFLTTLRLRQDEITGALLKDGISDGAVSFLINADEFGAVAGMAVTARSTDDSRTVLTGVRFEIEPADANHARLALVCTDGYRMVRIETSVDCSGDMASLSLLAPGAEIAHLAGLSGKGDLCFALAEDKLEVSGVLADEISFRLVTHLPDGVYPNYRAIIPTVDGDVIGVDLGELRRHLAAAKPFKRDDKRLDVVIDASAIRFRIGDLEKGDFESACPIQRTATETIEMSLNMAYFEAAVAGLLDLGISEPALHFYAPTRPLVFRGTKGQQQVTVVIMPMMARVSSGHSLKNNFQRDILGGIEINN